MLIKNAQLEMRNTFLGGSIGQAVSGLIWLVSAALGTWVSTQAALIALVIGGMFIFLLTQLILKLTCHPAAVSKENTLNQLAVQVAFIVPLCLPLIGVIASYNINYFYPAFMLVVGVHYLPFIFLYGMWQFGALSGLLMAGGTALLMLRHDMFITGGWFTAGILLIFAAILWLVYRRENLSASAQVVHSV